MSERPGDSTRAAHAGLPTGAEWRVPAGEAVALCRCGASRTKPFCDRSHREAGFASCERAPGP